MPLIVRKRGEKYRILESDTGRIARGRNGKALDRGGSRSAAALKQQAAAINIAQARKRGHAIPEPRR
jgi:hypothetical protein